MNCSDLLLLNPFANFILLKTLLKCDFNPFYKKLYLDNIHTRKVKWSDVRGGLVVEYRKKLCYIALVSAQSCEVGYNCRHLSLRIIFIIPRLV